MPPEYRGDTSPCKSSGKIEYKVVAYINAGCHHFAVSEEYKCLMIRLMCLIVCFFK